MSADNEVLWIVEQWKVSNLTLIGTSVFRSRQAARQFVAQRKALTKTGKRWMFTSPRRAKWGPEQ